MGNIRGDRTVEITAPMQACFDIAADLRRAPEWQGSLKDVDVLETDADGRASLVETESDAKVKSVRSTLRFRYDPPGRIDWEQERGEVKSLHGWWQFDDLGDGRTRATYGLDVDPGRMLGLLLRGPVQDTVMSFLLGNAAEGLKGRAESP